MDQFIVRAKPTLMRNGARTYAREALATALSSLDSVEGNRVARVQTAIAVQRAVARETGHNLALHFDKDGSITFY